MPGPVLSTAHAPMRANLATASGFFYCPFFVDEETEALRGQGQVTYKGLGLVNEGVRLSPAALLMPISLSVTRNGVNINQYHNFKNPVQKESSISLVIGWK